MIYYVYILHSQKDNGFYIGQTNNLEGRIKRHQLGQVRSTRNRRPLELIYYESYDSRVEAVKRETYLKKLKGGNEFKKIIESIDK